VSTHPAPSAKVYDLRPADLTRFVARQSHEPAVQSAAVLDDLADAIEAIHACANLAGFSERPRSLIFALASFTRARSGDYVELFDEELAQMQNCSTKTVCRQRAAYLREARAQVRSRRNSRRRIRPRLEPPRPDALQVSRRRDGRAHCLRRAQS
jgi:hypothetical protein